MKLVELETKFGMRFDWTLSPEQSKRLNHWASNVREPLIEKYCEGDAKEYSNSCEDYVQDKLKTLAISGVQDIKGKSFLDLGCGNSQGIDASSGRIFEPWLCRALLELGARPIGVDLGDNSEEGFENYSLDLGKSRSLLRHLEGYSVDVATALSLFDSPSIHSQRTSATRLMGNLRPQLDQIVNPDGLFIYNEFWGEEQ